MKINKFSRILLNAISNLNGRHTLIRMPSNRKNCFGILKINVEGRRFVQS